MDKKNDEHLVIHSKQYRGQTAVVSARLPIDLVQHLDAIAKESGRTRNEIMQLCLEFAVDRLEIKE